MLEFSKGLGESRRVRPMAMLNVCPGDHYLIGIWPRKKEWIRLHLHWNAQEKRRVPCAGAKCQCGGSGRTWALEERIYVPVKAVRCFITGGEATVPLHFISSTYLFGFTEAILDVLYECGGEGQWYVGRPGRKPNGKMTAKPAPGVADLGEWEITYPILFTLERVFGVRTKGQSGHEQPAG